MSCLSNAPSQRLNVNVKVSYYFTHITAQTYDTEEVYRRDK